MITFKSSLYNKFQLNNTNLQRFYNDEVNKIEITSLKCPNCHHCDFIYWSQYKRKVKIFNQTYTLSITRVFCNTCHKTHALLPSYIIPYNQISLYLALNILKDHKTIHHYDVSYYDVYNLINKYKNYWLERIRAINVKIDDCIDSLINGSFFNYAKQFLQIRSTINILIVLPT